MWIKNHCYFSACDIVVCKSLQSISFFALFARFFFVSFYPVTFLFPAVLSFLFIHLLFRYVRFMFMKMNEGVGRESENKDRIWRKVNRNCLAISKANGAREEEKKIVKPTTFPLFIISLAVCIHIFCMLWSVFHVTATYTHTRTIFQYTYATSDLFLFALFDKNAKLIFFLLLFYSLLSSWCLILSFPFNHNNNKNSNNSSSSKKKLLP